MSFFDLAYGTIGSVASALGLSSVVWIGGLVLTLRLAVNRMLPTAWRNSLFTVVLLLVFFSSFVSPLFNEWAHELDESKPREDDVAGPCEVARSSYVRGGCTQARVSLRKTPFLAALDTVLQQNVEQLRGLYQSWLFTIVVGGLFVYLLVDRVRSVKERGARKHSEKLRAGLANWAELLSERIGHPQATLPPTRVEEEIETESSD
jgi:hypothetical protein